MAEGFSEREMFPGNFFAQFCLGLGLAFTLKTLKRVEN